jgi:hypothetical protein
MSGDEQAHAFQPQTVRAPAGLPGARAAALIAIISALIAGYLARPNVDAANSAAPPGNGRLAEVAPDEIGSALETVAVSPEQAARFRAQEDCRRKLAWVNISRLPNQPAGRIRLQSGKYISPAFDLTDVPVRVALPYPAPYPTGHGTIAVVGTSSDANVALTPPWQVAAQKGFQSREVTWSPVGACPAAGRSTN